MIILGLDRNQSSTEHLPAVVSFYDDSLCTFEVYYVAAQAPTVFLSLCIQRLTCQHSILSDPTSSPKLMGDVFGQGL